MKTVLKISLLAATTLAGTPLYAQSQADAGYEAAADENVIIVTARKKEETLLDAPLAVSVVGEQELDQAGFTDITEITKVTPGAFVEAGGQNTNGFARINSTPRFRGISVLSGNPLQQTASVFLDGVYLSGGVETIGVNELQRVEVIKGPQSALFGRNTFAGAINYVTKDPSKEFRVDLNATAATRDEYSIAAGVEGPIMDGLSFRVGGSYSDKQGHYDNVAVAGQRLGDEQQWSINGTLLIEPSDRFRLKLRASYQEIDDGPAAAVASYGTAYHNYGGFLLNPDGTVDLNDSVQPAPLDGTRTESVYRGQIRMPTAAEIGLNSSFADIQAFRGFLNDARYDPTDAIFDFKYNPTNVDEFGLNLDALRLSAAGSVDLTDNIEFSFLGGYNKENFGFFADFDTSPDASFTGFTARETEDYTIEGRLSGSFLDDSLNISAGASYVDIDIAELGGVANFFAFPIFFDDIFRSTPFTSGAKTLGIFGSIDYEFNDQFSITLEGRYQEDEIRAGDVNAGLATPISPAKITAFLPRATLRYQPTNYTTLYATYSRGNLPGGFNPEVAELDAAQLAELTSKAPGASPVFGEEKLTNYEIGWKQQHPDGIFAFNMAAFYMQRSDEIYTSIVTITDTLPNAPNPLRTVNFVSNGATSDIYGIEFDAALNISENFSMQGSFAYIHSTIASFPEIGGTGDFGDIFGPAADVAGQEAPRFPPITISLGTTYEDNIDAFGDMFDRWFFRTDLFFTGEYYVSNANVARVQPATDVNLRLGLRGESYGLELFATNLFNETAPTTAQNFADTSFGTRTLPGGFFDFSREGSRVGLRDKRQFGIRLSATFK
ncbi:TonB-dependent receptor domain-containing protein [uncultured Parasphingorhabdus sp.]|uniref:TonB-dependent receptor n=1 Tax=uncultured Parasphingorhabdus sp. TaxID=2709694 RepID=UPI002AA6CCDF|nr:TonB-dependent receptor [uncultured Parasphingorhabdus sp.]